MAVNKISLGAGIIGILIIILSIILPIQRWWFVYYDPSQMLIFLGGGVFFGLNILVWAYVYNYMRKNDLKIKDFEHRIGQISKWWMEKEVG